MARALGETSREYGLDAVRLESHLLQYALQAGSVLAASARIGGIRPYGEKRFLVVELETGIVFNDDESDPEHHPARIWSEVVEPTLREFRTLEIGADGLVLEISYRHTKYRDRDDLTDRLASRPLDPDRLVFRFLTADILAMVDSSTSGAELLARSRITRNGRPITIERPDRDRGATTPPPTRSTRMLPEAWATKGLPL